MSIFQAVKEQVTTREAAEYYGIQVKRNGMARCIFHDDRNPSMKLDRRYHCFGCQADGDVIDFVGKMFGLSPYEAAGKLVSDFGIYVPGENLFHGQKASTAALASVCRNPVKNPADMSSTENLDKKQTNEKEPGDTGEACKEKIQKHGKKKDDKDNKTDSEEKKKERRICRLERQIQSWIERAEITLIQYLIYLEEWEARYRPAGPGENLHPLFCEAVSRTSIVRYQLETLLHGTDEDRLDFSRRKERG